MLTYRHNGERGKNIMTAIKNIEKRNTNPFYDREKSWDGGGYYQPEIIITLSDGGKVIIDDSSCGAFGKRYSAEYTDADRNQKARYVFDGTVPLGEGVYESGNFHLFPDIAEAVHAATGYNLIARDA